MVGFCLCIILQFIFNWNVENPSLLILSYTQIGLVYVLNLVNEKK